METLQRNANRGSISTGYDIDNSLKCQANSGNEWFYRNNPTTGNKRTFTFSFWLKRTQLDSYEADQYLMSQGSNARFHFAGHTLRFMFDGNSTELEAAGRLRDIAAWYHIVLAIDTTQATNTNRVKAYVNGEDYPFNNSDWPSQNQESSWMSGTDMYFNTRDGDGSYDNSGYWAEVAVVDGQQLAPTEFGEYNDDGVWVPKDLSDITFGNEGFWWNFSDASNLGADSSGNSNTATFNNLTTADLATDTPTNNFATINPLFKYPPSQEIRQGATQVTRTSGSGLNKTFFSTIGVSSGKWYAEFKPTASSNYVVGIIPDSTTSTVAFDGNYIGNSAFPSSISYYSDTGQKIIAPNGGSSYGDSYTTNDIIGVALDMDNGKLYFSKNGTYQNSGDPTSGSTGTGAIDLTLDETTFIGFSYDSGGAMQVNYGGYHVNTLSSAASDANGYGNFEYAPPSGYYAICTKNLAEYG